MRRALAFVSRHRSLGWTTLLAYAAAVSLPHENVQWLVNELAIRITHANVYRLFAAIALILGAMITLFLLRARRQPQTGASWRMWLAAIALIVGAWSTLTANNVELIHYPQYFPEGVALTALTLSPADALAWIAIFGGLDEGYQYWVLSHGRPTLLDFNDIYMDLLGGAAGIAFATAFLSGIRLARRQTALAQWRRPGVVALLSITASGVLLWSSGLMLIVEDKSNPRYWFALGRFRAPSFWAHIVANGPKHYHTLTPAEGIFLLWATIALFAFPWAKYALKAGDDARTK